MKYMHPLWGELDTRDMPTSSMCRTFDPPAEEGFMWVDGRPLTERRVGFWSFLKALWRSRSWLWARILVGPSETAWRIVTRTVLRVRT